MEGALEGGEDLRAPVKNIAENVWTGEKAVDYLINSKMTAAGEKGIPVEIDVEYPRNTGIPQYRSRGGSRKPSGQCPGKCGKVQRR